LQTLERQLLGFSLSAKPVDELIAPLKNEATHNISEVSMDETGTEVIRVAGVISDIRVVVTRKSGQEMAFVKIEDTTGVTNLVVFPRMFKETRDLWVDNKAILVTGRINQRDDETSIIVNSVDTEERLKDPSNNKVYIKIPTGVGSEELKQLKAIFQKNPGDKKVTLIFEGKNKKIVETNVQISWSEGVARLITEVLEGRAGSVVQ
jgi:DNA polymerase-3 subunit alpha